MDISEDRIAGIEKRIEQIEQFLKSQTTSSIDTISVPASVEQSPHKQTQNKITSQPIEPRSTKQATSPHQAHPPAHISITQLLGWTGVAAIVLAAVFLIRLALDAGWLTPWRQIDIAMFASFALIGIGLRLRAFDQQYASFLPAGGVVVQFCAVYGAHLYYHLINVNIAAAMVVLICFLTLWLGRKFNNEVYALFAVIGSYSAPLLLQSFSVSVIDLAVYFSAWSILYCVHSVWIGNRRPYLLAGYLAFLGFQVAASSFTADDWIPIFIFQVVQLVIFVTTTVVFSVRQKRPMSTAEAIAHFQLLLIFYVLQYQLLQAHIPDAAPWIAIASAAVLLLAHFIAQKRMPVSLEASNLLVGSYGALVLFHAVYVELIPDNFAPWFSLLILPIILFFVVIRKSDLNSALPYNLVLAILFVVNFSRVMEGNSLEQVAAHKLLALLYAVQLYVAYYLVRKITAFARWSPIALYAAHIALMIAAIHILENRLEVSIAWSAIALISLLVSFKYRDKVLGKSSLFIFAVSCAKVLLFDLSNSTPLVRIGTLLVLGGTLYVGGWMYKKVEE